MKRTLEVGIEHLVPCSAVQPQQDVITRYPGVVDQDIDPAQR